ncbi:MAG: hypothetical protein KF684_11345 [Phycisphaeraceae bacterium]|nr:hypothetical protein [Phycisphaeraceae bacterium]
MGQTFRLFNSLTRGVEEFVARDPGRVTFYTCGPTVYDYAHIGNFRSFLVADVARRWLESPLCTIRDEAGKEHEGPRTVAHVMNLTDVGHMTDDEAADGAGEDKMEAAAKRLLEAKKGGKLPPDAPKDFDPSNPHHIARFYEGAFLEDARLLGLKVAGEKDGDARVMPRATEHVREMLAMVRGLLERGCAYVSPDRDAVYFDTQRFPEYGRLSGNTLDKVRAGAGGRVSDANQSGKRHPADFLLWKRDSSHVMKWDPGAPEMLGADAGALAGMVGYPGWHIECSAMAESSLSAMVPGFAHEVDLHSGGEDNIFPHHECEIAQSRCAWGTERFARQWLHVRHLMVEGEKMSKSKGNFYTIRDLLGKGFDPAAIRLELIKTHYRSNANFTSQGLRDSQKMVERWRAFVDRGTEAGGDASLRENVSAEFVRSMSDDLNTAGAIGALNAWIGRVESPSREDAALLRELTGVLLDLGGAQADSGAGDETDALRVARDEARKAKNWAESDRLRDELVAMGYEVKDTAQGTVVTRRARL